MYITIRLLKQISENYIPDPLEIYNHILEVLDPNDSCYTSTVHWLSKASPSFYTSNDDNRIVVFYRSTTVKSNVDYIIESLKSISSFNGVTASWTGHHDQEEIDVVPNCFPYKEGVERQHPRGEPIYYLLNEEPPKAQVSISANQLLTLNVEPAAPLSDAPQLLNSLHKRLVSIFSFNHQVIGSRGNEFTSEAESINYNYIVDGDQIHQVTLSCHTGISDEILDLFDSPLICLFGSEKTEYVFTKHSNEYLVLEQANKFVTVTPAFPTGKIKQNGNLKLSPGGSFLQSINHILNRATRAPVLSQEGDWVTGKIDTAGLVRVRCSPTSAPYSGKRGGRRALVDDAFIVEIETEHPIVLFSIGALRRYGAGNLVVNQ